MGRLVGGGFVSFSLRAGRGWRIGLGLLLIATTLQARSALDAFEQELMAVARKVSPAVVSISAMSTEVVQAPWMSDPFWQFFFPPETMTRKVQSLGTGVVLSPSGEILTNAHVVEKADSILVTLPSGEQYPARLIGVAHVYDLALLKISPEHPLRAAKLGNSDSLAIGQVVLALGNPFGIYLEDLEPTVTMGVVSALHRTLKGQRDRKYYDMIQTDAAINPGNSGGPLVTLSGEVVGINTFILSSSGGSEGVGFAIPINTARKVVRELKAYGRVRPVVLGFRVQPLTPSLREALAVRGHRGILIRDLLERHPAARTLEDGDVLVELNGRPIYNVGDFRDVTYALVPGDVLRGKVLRDGKIRFFRFVVPELSLPPADTLFGATVRRVNQDLAWVLEYPEKSGLYFVRVPSGSVASRLGFETGDVLVSVNQTPVRSVREVRRIVQHARRIVFVIWRQGQRLVLQYWR